MGETSMRLAAIRRIYFYFVALITLIAGLLRAPTACSGLTVAWSGVGRRSTWATTRLCAPCWRATAACSW
ncbi:MAG: hypothetical protein R2838_11150 [Caldilineaceae bacterium]